MLAGVSIYFFLIDWIFSFSNISWQHRFERELRENGEVKLGSLVDFEWNKIHFLESYDTLGAEKESQLFTKNILAPPFWWQTNERYWTIAYQRPNNSPFLIRLRKSEWHLRRLTKGATTDRHAKLRLIKQDSSEAKTCTRPLSQCLALVEEVGGNAARPQ